MTLRTRRFLFYILAVLFLIAGGAAIFYSNGWRIDWETRTISQLGALYFNLAPSDATITIDKTNFKFRSGILRSGTLIANLFPKTYAIKVSKDGYQSWVKQLTVRPSLVTEVPSIVLLPEKLVLDSPIAVGVKKIWIKNQELILKKTDGRLWWREKPILGKEVAAWSADAEAVLVRTANSYFRLEKDSLVKPQDVSAGFYNLRKKLYPQDTAVIKKLIFVPGKNNQLLVLSGRAAYLLDLHASRLRQLYAGYPEDAVFSNGELVIMERNKISFINTLFGSKTSAAVTPPLTHIREFQVSSDNQKYAVLQTDGSLFLFGNLFNRATATLNKIGDQVEEFNFSPDSKKIAFRTALNELKIFSLAEDGTETKLVSLPIGDTEPGGLQWHVYSDHLFLKYPNSLHLLEVDSDPPINLQILDPENQSFAYNPEENWLYLLKKDSLYRFKIQ